nr:protein NRT1/ PTR FAMILY 7.3-like [Tanacetum cinerariifolium]
EEVKCVLRLLPIWLCTILSSVVFIQMISLFVEQGAAMNRKISHFQIPPASMTVFDIVSTSIFIICYDKLILPLYVRITKRKPSPPSELQRMGIGLAIATVAIITAGIVELHRLKYASEGPKETSSLSIFWQTPQYVLVGIAEAFTYVAQWEFFAAQVPDKLKSIGLGLSMCSSAMGSYTSSIILSVVMKITSKDGKPGWVPANLNDGHLDRFFFLCAGLTALNLVLFVSCAKKYKNIVVEKRDEAREMD